MKSLESINPENPGSEKKSPTIKTFLAAIGYPYTNEPYYANLRTGPLQQTSHYAERNAGKL